MVVKRNRKNRKKRFFVYLNNKEIVIDSKTQRELKMFSLELLRTFNFIQDCRAWVEKTYPTATVDDRVTNRYTGRSPETVAKWKATVRAKYPHGFQPKRPKYVRDKISATMKGKRCGHESHRTGVPHTLESRIKISRSRRRNPTRNWCVDREGKEHMRIREEGLPEGWYWGRNRRGWKIDYRPSSSPTP